MTKILIAAACIVAVAGCTPPQQPEHIAKRYENDYRPYVQTIRGHDYVVLKTPYVDGGVCIIHAAHCQCLQGAKP